MLKTDRGLDMTKKLFEIPVSKKTLSETDFNRCAKESLRPMSGMIFSYKSAIFQPKSKQKPWL